MVERQAICQLCCAKGGTLLPANAAAGASKAWHCRGGRWAFRREGAGVALPWGALRIGGRWQAGIQARGCGRGIAVGATQARGQVAGGHVGTQPRGCGQQA